MSLAALNLSALPSAATQRTNCYTPTYATDTTAALFDWRFAGGGSLSGAGNYYAICALRKEPPPGDPTGGPPLFEAPTAVDTVQIFGAGPGDLPSGVRFPIFGTITVDVPKLVGLGVISVPGSNITLDATTLSEIEAFSAQGYTKDATTIQITGGGEIRTINTSLGSVNVIGSVDVGSVPPTTGGFVLSAQSLQLGKDAGLTKTGNLSIGFSAGSVGALTVEGKTLVERLFDPSAERRVLEISNQDGFLFVGGNGTGTLEIKDFATVRAKTGFVAFQPGSTGTIKVGAGGELKLDLITSSSLGVGESGTGRLEIAGRDGLVDGGKVDISGFLVLGGNAGGKGTVTMADGSTLTIGGALTLGGFDKGIGGGSGAEGTFTMTGGKTTVTQGATLVGASQGSKGTLNVTGGVFETGNRLVVGHDGTGEATLGGTGTIRILSPGGNEGLRIGRWENGVGTLKLVGPDAKLEGLGDRITIGLYGDGNLQINDGFRLDHGGGTIVLGQEIGAQGHLSIDGTSGIVLPKASELIAKTIVVGAAAFGSVDVLNGAKLTIQAGGKLELGQSTGATGVFDIGGAASTLDLQGDARLVIGAAGKGTVTVHDGASLTLATTTLGDAAGSSGRLNIENPGTKVVFKDPGGTTGSLTIGRFGEGEVNVLLGGALEVTDLLSIAVQPGSSGKLFISSGSTVTVGRDFTVGDRGHGELTIKGAGSTLKRGDGAELGLRLGGVFGGDGTLTISDAADVTLGNLGIGGDGASGHLIVEAGTKLTNKGTVTIRNGGEATLNGTWDIQGAAAGARTLSLLGGTLSVLDKAVLKTHAVDVSSGATLTISAGASGGLSAFLASGESIDIGGTLRIDKAGTMAVRPEAGATATLNLQSGGSIVLTERATLAVGTPLVFAGSTAAKDGRTLIAEGSSVTVDGSSALRTDVLTIGGKVDLRDRSEIVARELVLRPAATITVDNATLSGFLQSPSSGGRISVANGGLVDFAVPGTSAGLRPGALTRLDISDRGELRSGFLESVTTNVSGTGSVLRADSFGVAAAGSLVLSGDARAIIAAKLSFAGIGGTIDARDGGIKVGTTSREPATGEIVIGDGGVLSGSGGSVLATTVYVDAGGAVRPGSSPGHLTIIGDLDVAAGAIIQIEVAGLLDGQFDVLEVLGDATFASGAAIDLVFLDGFAPKAGDSLDFLKVDGGIFGSFAVHAVSGLADGWRYEIAPTLDGGFRLLSLSDAVAAASDVPAPATLLLLAPAALVLLRARPRRVAT